LIRIIVAINVVQRDIILIQKIIDAFNVGQSKIIDAFNLVQKSRINAVHRFINASRKCATRVKETLLNWIEDESRSLEVGI